MKYLYWILTYSLLITGCVTSSLVKKPEASLVKGSTITVVTKGYDMENIQGEIEHILLQKGFNVVSEQVARKSIDIESKTNVSENQFSESASIYSSVNLNSVYMLSFQYRTRLDIPQGTVFERFTGSIVDLATGNLIASFKFEQGAFGSTSIQEALNTIFKDL